MRSNPIPLSVATYGAHFDGWRMVGTAVFHLKADAVDILFSTAEEAHDWARTRRLEAWTVVERRAWQRVPS